MSIEKLIRRSGVKLSIAGVGVGGAPESPVNFGRPKNQIQISDSRGTQQITDFETAAEAINQQITDGRTVSISWTANLVVDDPGYLKAEELYEGDLIAFLKVEATAIDGTTKKVWGYKGFLSDFSHTFQESGVAEVSCVFTASETYDWS